MKRTTAPNAVGGLHVDRVAGVTPGTLGIAEDRNNLQEEIAHPILLLGVALDGTDQYQLEKAIIGLSKPVGEVYHMMVDIDAVTWEGARNNSNPSNPRYNPIVKLWDDANDLGAANYPLAAPLLRAEKSKIWNGSALVTDLPATVSGSTLTGSGTAWTNALAALAEAVAVRGDYGDNIVINIAGTDFPLANVNTGAGTIAVTGSPTTGSQTVIIYPYRKSGSATAARTFKDQGRVSMSPDGVTYIAGLRRRDRMEGHYHETGSSSVNAPFGTSGAVITRSTYAGTASAVGVNTGPATSDGTNGTPRIGPTTDPAATIRYPVMHVGVLLA